MNGARLAGSIGRTVAAVAFTWETVTREGTAAYRRLAAEVCRRAMALCAADVDVIVITRSGAAPEGCLPRPRRGGGGRLLLSLGGDFGLLEVGPDGPRPASPPEAGGHPEPGGRPADVMQQILDALARRGVGPGLLLLVGSQFSAADGGPGADAPLLTPAAARMTAVSVGAEPSGGPAGVTALGGGVQTLLALLDEQLRRRAARRVPDIDEDPAWTLTETGDDPSRRPVTEALFTLGAAGLATRGTVEEAPPGAQPLVLAAGVYTGTGPAQHLLPGPVWTELAIEPAPRADRQVLDLRTGVLARTELTARAGPVRTLRLASITVPGVVAMRAEAAAGRLRPGPPLRQPPGLAAAIGRQGHVHWAWTDAETGSAATTGNGSAAGNGGAAGIAATAWNGGMTGVWSSAENEGGIGAAAAQHSRLDGETRVVERIAAYSASRAGPPDMRAAAARLRVAESAGFDRLLAEHRAAWAARWDAVDVQVPGDPDTQLALRFALFQLWSAIKARGELAAGARGLSGAGHGGHVSWDADVFLLPAVVTMDPAAAAAMIRYRLRRLDAARARARAAGLRGARFPWESAASGEDVTAVAGRAGGQRASRRGGALGGHAIPAPGGPVAEHITADVAWAAAHYAQWTDRPPRQLAALLAETARYWASRCRLDGDGRAHIDQVTGPDEYHEGVSDNAFTNVMARWNLRAAAASADVPPEESARWRDLAARLVDGYHPATGRYEQFAGYFDLEPLLAGDLLPGRDRVAGSQLISQPDVLMLHHLVPDEVAPGSLVSNLDFYGPRTTHGSPLSPAITASLLARAGRPDEALAMLRTALALDLDDLTGTTATGLHMANLGGIWQAIVAGFAGLRVQGGVLTIDPRLPAGWDGLRLRLHCLGRRVRLDITRERTQIWADAPLIAGLAGQPPQRVTGTVQLRWAAPAEDRHGPDDSRGDDGYRQYGYRQHGYRQHGYQQPSYQ